jgi:hypothetical protein
MVEIRCSRASSKEVLLNITDEEFVAITRIFGRLKNAWSSEIPSSFWMDHGITRELEMDEKSTCLLIFV